jgi:transcriptional regulator with XRE-family HTH domain
MAIHQNLKRIREQKNIPQQDIADRLHITQTAYSLIERGKTKIDTARVYQLAQILNIPYTDLMTDSDICFTFNYKAENSNAAHIQTTDSETAVLIKLLKSELSIKNEQISLLHKLLEQKL